MTITGIKKFNQSIKNKKINKYIIDGWLYQRELNLTTD
jgi:hypothetical protein